MCNTGDLVKSFFYLKFNSIDLLVETFSLLTSNKFCLFFYKHLQYCSKLSICLAGEGPDHPNMFNGLSP
jgi:hypothetical protein